MRFRPSVEKFTTCCAEMACQWSVNRTVAEVHALFYLSADPLSAEDISNALSVSRSNVSAGVRELEGRGLIRPVHVSRDRKQDYETEMGPWEAFRIILDDYKRRVIDPAISNGKILIGVTNPPESAREEIGRRLREVGAEVVKEFNR